MAGPPSLSRLRDRFPGLQRLGRLGGRRGVPYVQQLEASDCGAACLAMVLGFHGRETSLRETQEVLGAGRGGVSARDMLEAARRFGLRTRGVQLELSDVGQLPRGAVLHWGFEHFVVLERATARGLVVVDPAIGRREIPLAQAGDQFTGVALIFEPAEGFEHGRRLPGTLGGYMRRMLAHRPVIVRTLVLSALLQLLGLGLPLLVGVVVDRVVPRGDHDLLAVLAAGMGAVVVFHTVTHLLRSYLLNYLRTVLDAQLGLGFMDHLARLGYRYFTTRPSGDLLARFESNRVLRQTLTAASLSALLDGALVASYLVVILAVNLPMGALIVGLGLLQVVLFLVLRRPVRSLAAQELETQARSQSSLVEILAGMETLKAAGAEHRAVEQWSHRFVDELNVSLARARLGSISGALSSGVTLASPVAILLVGALQVLQGDLSLGLMLALNALAAGFLTPLANLVATAFQLQEVRSHIERIEDVMASPVEQEPSASRTAAALSGAIRIEGVGFRYGPREPWVVRDVDVDIEPGSKVAIVGRSGAGKSTLARLLVGLYRPEAGRVLYDGVDLAAMDLQALRSQIGVVTQDARVFGTTIRANIALTDPAASLDDVARAARMAEIHADIAAMPMGYDTVLSDGGASLSGGQRQRLALARALLRRPAILLLDEATSDLDTVTERRVIEHLARLRSTRVVIAHRLSTIADADLILVMDDGAVVERGRHEELLAAGGAYAALAASGTGAERTLDRHGEN